MTAIEPEPQTGTDKAPASHLTVAGVIAGLLGWFVLPIVLSPMAIILGVVGLLPDSDGKPRSTPAAVVSIVFGLMGLVAMLVAMNSLTR